MKAPCLEAEQQEPRPVATAFAENNECPASELPGPAPVAVSTIVAISDWPVDLIEHSPAQPDGCNWPCPMMESKLENLDLIQQLLCVAIDIHLTFMSMSHRTMEPLHSLVDCRPCLIWECSEQPACRQP